MCHILIAEKQVSPNTVNAADGCSALHYAARAQHESVIEYLLNQFARVHTCCTKNGATPLHYAVQTGNVHIVELLLKETLLQEGGGELKAPKSKLALKLKSIETKAMSVVKRGQEALLSRLGLKRFVSGSRRYSTESSSSASSVAITLRKTSALSAMSSVSSSSTLSFTSKSSSNNNTMIDAVVQQFISEVGPLIDVKNARGQTALHIAARKGYADIVSLLLLYGASVNLRDLDGSTALHHAAQTQALDICLQLLDFGAPVAALDNHGRSALHRACMTRGESVVKLLLFRGALVDQKDDTGSTPLAFAVSTGDEDLIEHLIEAGASPTMQDQHGSTPLHGVAKLASERAMFALLHGKPKIVDLHDERGMTPFHFACQTGKRELVLMLLQAGTKVDGRTNDNLTGLHLACVRGDTSVIELLIAHGANPNLACNGQMTALHWASKSVEITRLLCDGAKADLQVVNKAGLTLLHCAASRFGSKDTVEFFLERAPELLDKRDDSGATALHIAAASNNVEVVRMLLDCGCDTNAVCNEGNTALHYAASSETITSMLLLWSNKQINTCNNMGRTALHLAAMRGNQRVADVLVASGASVSIVDSEGETAINLAWNNNYIKLASKLKRAAPPSLLSGPCKAAALVDAIHL